MKRCSFSQMAVIVGPKWVNKSVVCCSSILWSFIFVCWFDCDFDLNLISKLDLDSLMLLETILIDSFYWYLLLTSKFIGVIWVWIHNISLIWNSFLKELNMKLIKPCLYVLQIHVIIDGRKKHFICRNSSSNLQFCIFLCLVWVSRYEAWIHVRMRVRYDTGTWIRKVFKIYTARIH